MNGFVLWALDLSVMATSVTICLSIIMLHVLIICSLTLLLFCSKLRQKLWFISQPIIDRCFMMSNPPVPKWYADSIHRKLSSESMKFFLVCCFYVVALILVVVLSVPLITTAFLIFYHVFFEVCIACHLFFCVSSKSLVNCWLWDFEFVYLVARYCYNLCYIFCI